jgi:hypothetical protein
MLSSCDVIIWNDNTPPFLFFLKTSLTPFHVCAKQRVEEEQEREELRKFTRDCITTSRNDPPTPSCQLTKPAETHTPPTPFVHSGLRCGLWPQHGHFETTQMARLKSRSNVSLWQFLNFPGCGENLSQSSACFSVAR